MSYFLFCTPKVCPDVLWFPYFLFRVCKKLRILIANQSVAMERYFDKQINVTSR